MEQRYSKKDMLKTNGPSDLTIKRILAFSKALKAEKKDIKPSIAPEKEN